MPGDDTNGDAVQQWSVINTPIATISESEFAQLASLVDSHIGIKMSASKKAMVGSRLLRRLQRLGLVNYRQYHEYLQTPSGWEAEMPHFADLVTTHKTSFFREPEHFEVLTETILPQLLAGQDGTNGLSFWSAGCASGEEVYTLRMLLAEFSADPAHGAFEFSILGTDVSEFALQKARLAIYPANSALEIPEPLRKKYLLRSRNSNEQLIRIVPALRARTCFQQLNFKDEHWSLPETFHVIFCRNVLIYFNPQRQERIIAGLCRHLRSGGFLFLGHAETAARFDAPLRPVMRNVYRMSSRQGAQRREAQR